MEMTIRRRKKTHGTIIGTANNQAAIQKRCQRIQNSFNFKYATMNELEKIRQIPLRLQLFPFFCLIIFTVSFTCFLFFMIFLYKP
jgi:hypothetical protein